MNKSLSLFILLCTRQNLFIQNMLKHSSPQFALHSSYLSALATSLTFRDIRVYASFLFCFRASGRSVAKLSLFYPYSLHYPFLFNNFSVFVFITSFRLFFSFSRFSFLLFSRSLILDPRNSFFQTKNRS